MPPPFLAGLTLLFWSWQTGQWVAGLILAGAVEARRWVAVRFEVGPREVRRMGGFTALLLAGAAIFSFTGTEAAKATADLLRLGYNPDGIEGYKKMMQSVLTFTQWLPATLVLLALGRAYSGTASIDLMPLLDRFPSVRRELLARSTSDAWPLRTDYPYAAICLLGACGSENGGPSFFWGLSALVGYALWPLRRRRLSSPVWIGCFGLCVALGWAGQVAALQVRDMVQRFNQALAERFTQMRPDADETRTAIGSIGSLKQSGRIVLRIEPVRGQPPLYLREAVYNGLRGSVWMRVNAGLDPVPAGGDGTSWDLGPGPEEGRGVWIMRSAPGGRTILAAPFGATELRNLDAVEVVTNRLGSMVAKGVPGWVRYRVSYDARRGFDGKPDAQDLAVPPEEVPHLGAVSGEIGASNLPPVEVAARVADFFSRKFSYTLALTSQHRATAERTALGVFLIEARSGHCEYFATATVLLLRHFGVPARYVTGFAVDERQGRIYVARQRHAHAWCAVWVNGAWQELDTTPSSWHSLEDSKAPAWEPLTDFFASVWHRFSRWRAEGSSIRPYLLGGSLLLLGVLAVRLAMRGRLARARVRPGGRATVSAVAGGDSEFLGLQARAEALGFGPRPDEPAGAWVRRVGSTLGGPREALSDLLALHQRYRFDPNGLSGPDRERLRREASSFEVRAAKGA